MRCLRTKVVALALALIGCGAGVAVAAEDLQALIKKVDAKLYHPQRQGMRSLQADVQSSWLAEQVGSSPEAKNATLRFYWAEPYKQRFVLTGVPDAMGEQARQVENRLAMWGERLVTKSLAQSLADYRCTLSESEKTFTIDAQTTAPSARIEAMRYTIDKKTLLPTRWRIATSNWSADVDIKHDTLPTGLSVPVQMKAQADGSELLIRMAYKKVEKWNLVETLTVSFAGGDGTSRTTSLRLSNFKINEPVPADIFREKRE